MRTLSIVAANHDPERFERPEIFDIARGGRDHFTFGRGLHFCLGAALARVEAQEALRAVASRISDWELQGDAPRWIPYAAIRRLDALRLRVKAA